MEFIDQLRAAALLHSDMQTESRSRRYHQAQNIAAKYLDFIREEASEAAHSGRFDHLEGRSRISGFCALSENDFESPIVTVERSKPKKGLHRKRTVISRCADNELFEVFLSAFSKMCADQQITLHPFQVRIIDHTGQTVYHTLPCILHKPKKDRVDALGFPYEIYF